MAAIQTTWGDWQLRGAPLPAGYAKLMLLDGLELLDKRAGGPLTFPPQGGKRTHPRQRRQFGRKGLRGRAVL